MARAHFRRPRRPRGRRSLLDRSARHRDNRGRVAAGGAGASAGFQKGDILVGLHLWEALNLDNVAFVLNHKDFATFLPLKFYLSRDGKVLDGWITGVP